MSIDLKQLTWDNLMGPGTIPCDNNCIVPEGIKLEALPAPRHNWPDVLVCPYNCGRAFFWQSTQQTLTTQDSATA